KAPARSRSSKARVSRVICGFIEGWGSRPYGLSFSIEFSLDLGVGELMANPNDNLPCPCSHSQFTKCALFNFAKTAIGHFQGLYDNSRRSREETFSNYFPHRFLERSLCPSKLADKEASRSESGRR